MKKRSKNIRRQTECCDSHNRTVARRFSDRMRRLPGTAAQRETLFGAGVSPPRRRSIGRRFRHADDTRHGLEPRRSHMRVQSAFPTEAFAGGKSAAGTERVRQSAHRKRTVPAGRAQKRARTGCAEEPRIRMKTNDGHPRGASVVICAGPVSRVLCPDRSPGPCHLSRTTVSRRLKQPTPRHRTSNP